jgi:hypothetical protein
MKKLRTYRLVLNCGKLTDTFFLAYSLKEAKEKAAANNLEGSLTIFKMK